MFDHIKNRWLLFLFAVFLINACAKEKISLEVTATSFTSRAGETDSNPRLAAWGNVLKPGMKAVAVSRDLLDLGLKNGSEIWIAGLPGKYKVMDKMHKRWKKKIDIYMGNDTRKAREWGKRKVVISWLKE
jgi:3D (Asp-Asp-Asp) domain-containing protein